MQFQVNISGAHYSQLKKHLYPGDGNESVALALCGRFTYGNLTKLMVHEVCTIPAEDCYERAPDFIHWKTDKALPLFEKAYSKHFSVLKIHSHPTGYRDFSGTDDKSDVAFFDSAYGWISDEGPHASLIMLPDGELFGRVVLPGMKMAPVHKFLIAGDSIEIYPKPQLKVTEPCDEKTAQVFGEKTYSLLRNLKIGIVGCSGTGSPTIEQLKRLGVGELVLADPDIMEFKNLNRILNSSSMDAAQKVLKVDVMERSIHETGLGTKVKVYSKNLYNDLELLKDLCTCDSVIGCMDSVDGRDLLNQLATYFIVPYFDFGVKLEADGKGGIKEICGGVHYLQPGKSSLLSRNLYDTEDLKAAGTYRRSPEEYAHLLKNSYIRNIHVSRPAVISVNMMISSLGVNELLNRIHSFRLEEQANYAVNAISITGNYIINTPEEELVVDQYLLKKVGRGTTNPFLDNPELMQNETAVC